MRQKGTYPVIDMHCDLLSFLAEEEGRDALSALSNASLPQLKCGGVKMQVMAIFTSNSPSAATSLRQQMMIFLQLQKKYPDYIQPLPQAKHLTLDGSDRTYILPAFENAAGFAQQSQSISAALEELSKIKKLLGPIAYISMTWDGENRFGGGVGSSVGLKNDGQYLLEWMNEAHVPIDLSHASDFLIDDILSYIDKKCYDIPVMASHSNFRQITPMQRNLSDDMAREIIKRKGLIGLNFFCHFSGGKVAKDILSHIDHAMKLKAEDSLCMGADFFCDKDLTYIKQKYNSDICFYPELKNSSCYPWLFSHAEETLGLDHALIEKISNGNAKIFLERLLQRQK